MSMFSVHKDINNPKTEENIAEQGHAAARGSRQGLYFLGRALRDTARAGIKDPPKTGFIYRVKRKGGTYKNHQASAPGEYPANLSGTLRGSIKFLVVGTRQLVFGAEAPYAKWLETGTRHMEARPTLFKSVTANEGNASRLLAREFQRALINEGR